MACHCAPATDPIVRPRMPELDSLRGVAILSVFAFHAIEDLKWPPFTRPLWQRIPLAVAYQGWTGVNLFFVLSGFLITGILLDSRQKPEYYSRFYSHRVLRILPAYYMMLLLLFLLWCVRVIVTPDMVAFLGLSVIYLSNLTPLFGVNVGYWSLWSLAVEEHFYLLWPAIVRWASRRWLTVIAITVCVIEPALRLYALQAGTDLWWAGPHRLGSYRYTWLSADPLAMGALLAIFARSAWGSRKNLLRLVALTTFVTVTGMLISLVIPSAAGICLRGTLVNYGALAVLGGALWLGTGPYRKWANFRVLSFYGYISYSLYLIHDLVIEFYSSAGRSFARALYVGTDFNRGCLRFFVSLAIATGIAYLSRTTVEEYFLRMKDKPAKATAAARSAEAA